jgi:hypothetical protein
MNRSEKILKVVSKLDSLPADHEPTVDDLWEAIRRIERIAKKDDLVSIIWDDENDIMCVVAGDASKAMNKINADGVYVDELEESLHSAGHEILNRRDLEYGPDGINVEDE